MYALIENEKVVKYPCSFQNLKELNPGLSLPFPLSSDALELIGAVEVKQTLIDYNPEEERVIEILPIFDGTNWIQNWKIETLTQEEKIQKAKEKVNYIGFNNQILKSIVYQTIRNQALTSLELTVALAEFISAMGDAKIGHPDEYVIQGCISNILSLTTLNDNNLLELENLFNLYKLSPVYILSSVRPELPVDVSTTTGNKN